MQFSALRLTVFAAVFTSAQSVDILDQDVYSKHVAGKTLDRLQQYRATHGDLTLSQSAILDLAEGIIHSHSTDDLPAPEALCLAAFTAEECNVVMTGGEDASPAARGLIGRGPPSCE